MGGVTGLNWTCHAYQFIFCTAAVPHLMAHRSRVCTLAVPHLMAHRSRVYANQCTAYAGDVNGLTLGWFSAYLIISSYLILSLEAI